MHVSTISWTLRGPPRDESELAQLEAQHRIYDLFIWLSWRFQSAFQGRDFAVAQQSLCAQMIEEGLHNLTANRTPRRTSAAAKLRRENVGLGAVGLTHDSRARAHA